MSPEQLVNLKKKLDQNEFPSYLMYVTYESGAFKIFVIHSLEEAAKLKNDCDSGMTGMLSCTVFAKIS